MLLPATSLACLLLLFLALFCWGSWANTQRLVFKWRFELFYYDFTLGLAICALIAVFTLGSMNPQELTVSDNFLIASYRKIAYAVGAGVLVNLGNMLLIAAISLSGMAVAYPIAFGVSLVVMSVTNFLGNSGSNNIALFFGGIVLILAAVVVDALAYNSYLDGVAAAKSGPTVDPRSKFAVKPPTAAKTILLSVLAGIALGFFLPIVDYCRALDNGVSSYGIAGLVAFGMFLSTLLYVPFFVNFPVQGQPVQVRDYFKGAKKQHFWGIFGGIIWGVGLLAALVAQSAPPSVQATQAVTTGILQAVPILGALWGFLVWKDFKGAAQGVKMLFLGTVVLYLAGLALVALAPMYASK